MTTVQDTTTAPNRTMLLAGLGVVTSSACTAVGTFLNLAGDESDSHHDVGEWLFAVGIALVAAVLVFGLVVRTANTGNPSRRAAILGVVAVLSIAVFWSGLPMVLATGALACALIDRDKVGSMGLGSKAGVLLAALATVAAVVLAISG